MTPIRPSLPGLLRDPKFLPMTFLAFVGLRLAFIFLVPVHDPVSDSAWYFNRAVTLAEQGTYSERGIPTAYWPVGYPGFLGLLFKITGPSLLAAKLANLVLAAATFWLLYFFVRRSLGDELAARGAVMLLTIYPNNAAYVPLLLTETLYTCLLLGASLCLMTAHAWRNVLLAGAIFGLATLVKTQTIALVPVLAFVAFLDRWSIGNVGRAALRSIGVACVAVAVVLPWSLRNLELFGTFVFVSTNGGMNLLAGNHSRDAARSGPGQSSVQSAQERIGFSVEDQVGADRRARQAALAWIAANPAEFVKRMPKKVYRMWAVDGEGEWGYQDTPFYDEHRLWFRGVRIVNQAFYFVMLLLFVAAVWKLAWLRAGPAAWYGVAVVVMLSSISAVIVAASRFHFPVMPFVLGYVAWFLVRLSGASNRPGAARVSG